MPDLLPPPLRERLPGPELMDSAGEDAPDELRDALVELRRVNRWLGGRRTTWRALDDLAARTDLRAHAAAAPLEVLDAGGGSGDVAEAILAWGRARGVRLRVTVLDLDPVTVRVAAERLAGVQDMEVRQGDLLAVPPASFDVVHAALVLHHFDGEETVRALRAMARAARIGVVVNDLHRHAVPWTLIRLVTAALSRNRLIRNDGPLSVARGFTAEDWRRLGPAAGVDLAWRRSWAWRWAVSGVPR